MSKGIVHCFKYLMTFVCFCVSCLTWAQGQANAPSTINTQTEFQNWLDSNGQTAAAPSNVPAATKLPPMSSMPTASSTTSVSAPTSPPPSLSAAMPPVSSASSTSTAPLTSSAPSTSNALPAFLPSSSAVPSTPVRSSFPPAQLASAEPGPVVQTTITKTTVKKPRVKILPITMPIPADSPVLSPPLSYKQSQKIMLHAIPPSPKPDPDSAAAFNAMMRQNMPINPRQVVEMRQMIDTSQRAASIPPTVPPKPVSSTLIINLAPGATPPAIRLAQGYVSSLVFVDSTGSPWPIASFDIGDPKATNIQWDGKSNILLLQAVTPYSAGNLVIRLAGLPTPISLEIVSGQRVVDYRTDIHVPGLGPNAVESPVGAGLPESANQLLLSVLDGVAPPGSKPLTVAGGGDCQAWLLGDKMFLRTRFTLLSPGWVGKMSSPDGMYAYEIQRTSSVLISLYGNPVELKIEGF